MTYSNYATKLNNDTNIIEKLLTNISQMDLDTTWEGNAAKKQLTNLRNLLNDKNIQIQNLETLSSVLLILDEYDNEKKLANEYQTNINNLNTSDPNYQTNKDNLMSLKNKSVNKYESLKKEIEEKLSNIVTRYSEQYVDLPATTIENTANLFLSSQSRLAEIDNHLTMKITPLNGDKTSSLNAGTIHLDKQGTYYDTEPTPGKAAQKLHVYHNGQRVYDDACITIKKGETIRLTVNLSDNAGEVKQLTRTSASGQGEKKSDPDHWTNWFTAKSEPFVNRYDSSTFVETDNYDWVITGDQVTNGYVILSQTTFHSTDNAPEFKSMYRIRVKVVE